MLAYRVHRIQTGVYIYPWANGEEATLSVSGDHQVTLHCAGDLISDPFPFDEVVFAPFHNTLYSCCVADGVRLQFGSAVQRRAPSFRDVPRRTTIVHGDPVSHVGETFYNVLLLAAEEVERIAGARHSQSAYECVFNVVRVYPWGEEDLLEAAGRAHCRGSASSSGTAAEQGISLWNKRTSVPLRTSAQRQLFKSTLKQLCCGPRSEGRDDTAACVQQVRLAVYAPARDSTAGDRVLCAEHLFSLVPSVCDVGASFGTTMEALCEMLVCRRQGNVLDNPLLPVLLPGVSVDCLTILTCISARGEHASRPCIDACCFGCSSERRRHPTAASSLAVPPAGASGNGTAKGTPARGLAPLLRQPVSRSAFFQRMTGDLLMSVAPSIRNASWQTSQPQKPSATTPRTPPSGPSRASNSDPFAQLDESVDRLLMLRRLKESPAGKPSLLGDGTTSTSPPSETRRTASALPATSGASALSMAVEPLVATPPGRAQNESCESSRGAEIRKLDSLQEASALIDGANMVANGRAASACRLDESASARALEIEAKVRKRCPDYYAKEATLSLHHEELQTPCAELVQRERKRHVLVDEGQYHTAELWRTARVFQSLEPSVESLRQREQELSAYLKMLDSYVAYVNATCRLYTDQVDAKMLLMDGVKRYLTRRISIAAWVERAGILRQRCEHYDRRVDALQRQEAALSHQMHSMELEATALRTEVQRLEELRDTTERDIAEDKRAAAARQVKALEEYEESLVSVRRVQGERDAVAREVADLAARRAEAAEDVACRETERDAVRAEVHALEAELAGLQATLDAAREAGAAESTASSGAHGAENAASKQLSGDEGALSDSSLAAAKGVIEDELHKVIEELAVATEELVEVEDVIIEEVDRAVMVLRRCDGEMTLRFDRLMDRCASFIDVESRLARRSASMFSESSSQRHTRM
ncbi:hypothetical protein conserved [Leishmania donovani]|uniref:Hypothetical_protein_conserved n=1 Tax=Leishmania donovani TaxID=5661 RepID=A0A6J8FIP4_LEIDO|nr:hypothetical protein conserved [Leishmania donovani]VDZ47350.1 hypothetical_protein_conserved [Leishmania donovani]